MITILKHIINVDLHLGSVHRIVERIMVTMGTEFLVSTYMGGGFSILNKSKYFSQSERSITSRGSKEICPEAALVRSITNFVIMYLVLLCEVVSGKMNC
jgi:hypothetical protein